MKYQQDGLEALIQKENTYVLQHSELQKNYIVKRGFNEKKVFKLSPPICPLNCGNSFLPDRIIDFISLHGSEMLLISTVARIDYFKNIELLIYSSLKLIEEGIPIKVLIAGGSNSNSQRREQLYEIIPNMFRENFLIIESLPQNEMYFLFNLLKQKAVFVCTSRYETVGITPLEAAISGVYSIFPDSNIVEVANYFPQEYKFTPSVIGLTNHLRNLYLKKSFSDYSQYNYIKDMITIKRFEDSFMYAISKISQHNMEYQKALNKRKLSVQSYIREC